jgi:hypothetical protein
MQPVKAQVRNGRLVVDEPTDLPEGKVLYLVPMDERDELEDDERDELYRELDASIDEARAGMLIDGGEVLAEIRARRA